MSRKFTRKLMPVRFEVDEPICMIVPLMKTYAASSSPFFAHATTSGESMQRQKSARESECSGKPTTRGAGTSTVRPGQPEDRTGASA